MYISETISKAISQLASDFLKYPNKYLTEDDVRVHLCYLLMNDFGVIEATKDGDCSISLHTEIRWWGDKKLKYRSDIVLLDVAYTEVTRKKILQFKQHTPKGYACGKVKGVIEIKFRRNVGYSDNQFLKGITRDYEKLKEIKNMVNDSNTFYGLVVFDKRQNIRDKLTNFSNEGIEFTYKFANRIEGGSIT